jgi:hypothetical protein
MTHDLILRFQLERRGDETKHYQKMKQSQRAHFNSMKKSMTQCESVVTSIEGEASPRREKKVDDAS